MPRPRGTTPPKYGLHKASGRARAWFDGREHWLGRYGSKESKARYAELLDEWSRRGEPVEGKRRPFLPRPSPNLTVARAIEAFKDFCEAHYLVDGKVSPEVDNLRLACREVRIMWGSTPLSEFGPLKYKAVREALVERGLARSNVNATMGRVRRWARWCVENELAPADLYQRLQAVPPLLPGRGGVKESKPVEPVPLDQVEVILPLVRPTIAAMVRLQLTTGMRPGEVTRLTMGQLDRSGEVWVYRPSKHKTSWRGKSREVYIGPRGQEVLAPWLKADPDAPLFSPADDHQAHVAEKRAKRKSKVQPSQAARAKRRKKDPKRAPGLWYETREYAHAIRRGCNRAGVPVWGPNRLRHTFATICRREFGVEGAQVMLGHSRADVTQLYAEVNGTRAAEIARKIG